MIKDKGHLLNRAWGVVEDNACGLIRYELPVPCYGVSLCFLPRAGEPKEPPATFYTIIGGRRWVQEGDTVVVYELATAKGPTIGCFRDYDGTPVSQVRRVDGNTEKQRRGGHVAEALVTFAEKTLADLAVERALEGAAPIVHP